MNKIIYQIALRTFTPEGTFAAASKLLKYVASLNVDIVYVCPFFTADDDMEYRSKRQLASKTDNPKNPYRIADYFSIDEEYGTLEDAKDFVREAHRCGLEVMFDLVYLHAGPNAVFIKDHPEWFVRNEDGSILIPDEWPFPRLNYEERSLRDYLISNMKYLITDLDADGFRCDCGDYVPLDFWTEAFEECRKIKPGLITLNEGCKAEYAEDAFDMMYPDMSTLTLWAVFKGEKDASAMRECFENEVKKHGKNAGKGIRYIDSHDTASDSGLMRNEITMTNPGMEAALILTHTLPGIPFVWNGVEFCDDSENNMFSNRFYGKRCALNWSKAFTADGEKRMSLIRELNNMYHSREAINSGDIEWIDTECPDSVIAYIRKTEKQRILVVINTRSREVKININENIKNKIMDYDIVIAKNEITLGAYGYLISEIGGDV